jgi:sugar/nucleoside kinase (ribokinase family)
VIVVVGDPVLAVAPGGAAEAGGPAVAIARSCVRSGATVQLVGKVGDDPAGDEVLLSLAGARIGHVAMLRDAGQPTTVAQAPAPEVEDEATLGLDVGDEAEDDDATAVADPPARPTSSLGPEDLDLALRYLTSFGVLVVAQAVTPATLAAAVENAAYAGAHLVLIDAAGEMPAVPADDLTVLESPDGDPDGDFAGLVGRYTAALDGGISPAAAFRTALGPIGAESASV